MRLLPLLLFTLTPLFALAQDGGDVTFTPAGTNTELGPVVLDGRAPIRIAVDGTITMTCAHHTGEECTDLYSVVGVPQPDPNKASASLWFMENYLPSSNRSKTVSGNVSQTIDFFWSGSANPRVCVTRSVPSLPAWDNLVVELLPNEVTSGSITVGPVPSTTAYSLSLQCYNSQGANPPSELTLTLAR